ncbi:hypothetical protein BGZ63DRAFT_353226 [Mariannaea sp. PMI_226]|nr:hypothetical protein BGZ63DRAFT_353226 [Mariannaea sp. PMI_226]
MDSTTAETQQPWFLHSSYPVLFPAHDALKKPQADFEEFLRQDLSQRGEETEGADADTAMADVTESETFTLVSNSTAAEIRQAVADTPSHPFMDGLRNYKEEKEGEVRDLEGMMLTDNGDLAFRSSDNALVDLFQELETSVTGPRLSQLLQTAWAEDPLVTLKIIFNARSIHLGKSAKNVFYRCAGWLAQHHPLTLVANLQWLSRPIIEKTAKKEGEDDLVIIDEKDLKDESENDPLQFDVKHGVSHGYWKDLLNILALAANEKLGVLSDPRDVLNTENPNISRGKSLTGINHRGEVLRRQTREQRHQAAVDAFNNDPVYRALHLTIARLFADQLESDLRALRGQDPKAKEKISLCSKWAPSHDHFHDRHTFIISSIAEILYPRDELKLLQPIDDRERYMRLAREEYRKDTSALRKHLDVVERNISANTFSTIKYERVPSIAMNNYSKLFIEKDLDRFDKYTERVAEGKAKISGATLLPSLMVAQVEELRRARGGGQPSMSDLIQSKLKEIETRVLNGQWNTLVQRIRDSGTLENCIAVCDVSGSMESPTFADKTTPMHSALGLSLLIAEVAKPPFNGSFITFSARPQVVNIDLTQDFASKVREIEQSDWGMNTDFTAVFEKLILPMAIKNNLKKEDMIKRIFVFSDMHFDEARDEPGSFRNGVQVSTWTTAYERIQKAYEQAGYDVPELVFWNLAGGASAPYNNRDPTAPKQVNADQEGTCMVSGYSQGLLKVFMENGAFDDDDAEEEEEEANDDPEEVIISKEGEEINEEKKKKKKKKAVMTPIAIVHKAVGHKAYKMLKVLD